MEEDVAQEAPHGEGNKDRQQEVREPLARKQNLGQPKDQENGDHLDGERGVDSLLTPGEDGEELVDVVQQHVRICPLQH